MNLTEYPESATTLLLGQKIKRGRQPNNTATLIMQPSVLNRLTFQLKLRKSNFENLLCLRKSILEKVFLISIEFNVFDETQCLSQVFFKVLKLFSRTNKNFQLF